MKKVIIAVIVLLLFVCVSGCHVKTKAETPECIADLPNYTEEVDAANTADIQASLSTMDTKQLFQQELKQSFALFLGTYLRKETKPDTPGVEFFRFTVECVYWGDMQEQEIVLEMPITDRNLIKPGQQYLLPIYHYSEIGLPTHKYYSWAQIPVKNDGCLEPFQISGLDADLPFQTVEECVSYCSKIVDLSQNGSIRGWPYTLSEDLTEVTQKAPCVFIGYFTDAEHDINHGHMKKFNVTTYLKGEIPEGAYAPTNEDGNKTFPIFNDYEIKEIANDIPCILACAYSYSERPTCCVFARKNAVIPLSDTERVNEVYAALGIEPEE